MALSLCWPTACTPSQCDSRVMAAHGRAKLDGTKISSPLQITTLNPGFKDKPIAKTEVLQWKGANDDDVEGILYYPDDYKAGKAYPLIVATHGGPASADHDQWSERWGYAPNLMT